MEKPNERKEDELLIRGTQQDGSDIEIRRGNDGVAYMIQKDQDGKIVEFSNLAPLTEEGDVERYFTARGMALTDAEIENLRWKFQEMKEERENKILDAHLEEFDETKAREQ